MTTQQEARDHVRRMIEQAQERADAAHRMVGEMEALRIVGRSREGTTVTLGHTGGLIAVELGERLGQADLRRIEASIAEANADAQYRLQTEVKRLAHEHYGADSATARDFDGKYDQLFPAAAPTPEERQGPGSPFGQGRGR